MKIAEVTYLGELRTKAVHLASGNTIITDAPIDNQGKGEYFSPTDLVAVAVASCVLTIIGINSKNSNIDITGTIATVTKTMNTNPRRIGTIHVNFKFPNINYSEKQKQTIKKIIETCPVVLSLHPEIKKLFTLEYNDEKLEINL
ncbi:MAG: OsmC family protein [Bacteroidales bacterium]|nr:OsmC family protein [Bacteroidales bacterium]